MIIVIIIINAITMNIWAEIAQSEKCVTTDWTTEVRSPAEAKNFFL
jgi:hypothetical protein